MGDVSATETAIVYGLEPVWGAAFAWFLLGERWDNTTCIGAALVLCKLMFLFLVLCLCTRTALNSGVSSS
jgi:drug/metabolite transporter (DMT)-like permease